jgi:preprotein translocase subunit YajC
MDQAFAQTVSGAAPAGNSAVGTIFQLLPIFLIMIVFYFLMIVPQNKERKKKEEMLKSIQRGDRVLTRGGIYGTVADIREQVIVLKINENSKIEVDRSYIESVERPS